MTMGVGGVGGVNGNGGSIGGKPTRRGCLSSNPLSGTHLGRGKTGSMRTWVLPMRWGTGTTMGGAGVAMVVVDELVGGTGVMPKAKGGAIGGKSPKRGSSSIESIVGT